MTVEIYPNALSAAPFEVHETSAPMSIAEWMASKIPGFSLERQVPFAVTVNGQPVAREDWALTVFKPSDDVRFVIVPRGTDPISITAALFKGVQSAFKAIMPKVPGVSSSGGPASGDPLKEASAKGNKVKLGDPVREVGGRMKVYPDYLQPPHRIFANPREQWVELMLCVGVGEFDITPGSVSIGDTSLDALGLDASYVITGPGGYVGNLTPNEWWHPAPEVGASSTGSSGLELTKLENLTPSVTAGVLQFSGKNIIIPAGQGTYPTDWAVGLTVRVIAPYTYTVTDGGAGVADLIEGDTPQLMPMVAGDAVEVVGPNAGHYLLSAINTTAVPGRLRLNLLDGTPAQNLSLGTASATIGREGLRYRITAITPGQITVDRLSPTGSVDSTWPGFTAMSTGAGSITVDTSTSQGGWRGPFPAVPANEKTQVIEFDIFCPNGLCGFGKDGNMYALTTNWEVQWRDMAVGGAWTAISYSRREQSRDAMGFTYRITLPYSMRPEVRMRRLFPNGRNDTEWIDTTVWYGLKGFMQSPISYPKVTTVAVRVRASDRIAMDAESQINLIATRRLPTRTDTGAWTTPVATRDIAPFALYVLKSLGYPDSRINLDEFDALDALWKARGDTYDNAITDYATAKNVINQALSCGFAEFSIDRNQVRPVRDGPVNVPKDMYTPQNQTQGVTRSIELPNIDDFDGVEVEYLSSITWQKETILCQLAGDEGRKIEKITAEGVTDATRAWRYGMRRRRTQKYRRNSFDWSTEYDGRNSRYMDLCALTDDVPGYSQSAILRGYQPGGGGAILTVGEAFEVTEGVQHQIAVRRPDGTFWGPVNCSMIGDKRISVGLPLDFVPTFDGSIEPPHVMFGTPERLMFRVLITSMKPNGMQSTSMTAVGYDARVYLDDDGTPP